MVQRCFKPEPSWPHLPTHIPIMPGRYISSFSPTPNLRQACSRALGHLLVLISGAWYLKAWVTFQSTQYAWWYKGKCTLFLTWVRSSSIYSKLFWRNLQLCDSLLVRLCSRLCLTSWLTHLSSRFTKQIPQREKLFVFLFVRSFLTGFHE